MALSSGRSLSKERFRNRLIDALRSRLPLARIQGVDDLSIAITEVGPIERTVTSLETAYREFEANPEMIENIIGRWADTLVATVSEADRGIDLSAIVPIIRTRKWLADTRTNVEGLEPADDRWNGNYNEDLVIALVEMRQSGFHFLTQREIMSSFRSVADLREAAFENLRRHSRERTMVANNGIYLIAACGGLGASLLLDETLWSDDALKVRGNFLIGVPARDDLVVAGTDDPFDVFRIAGLVSKLYKTERYPLSERLYVWRTPKFVPLETRALDSDHPIPDLDVLDMHVVGRDGCHTLSIIIASPMKADARSVYRLFRKLDVYLIYLASPDFKSDYGPLTPGNAEIAVHLHRLSDRRLVSLLHSCVPWVADRGAKLSVIQAEH